MGISKKSHVVGNSRVFSNESVLHIRWPKYWSFSFNINHSNEYSGLISFRIDWFDLHAIQGTLKSLLQHHSSKASILCRLAFFIVQLSHSYMTAGKTYTRKGKCDTAATAREESARESPHSSRFKTASGVQCGHVQLETPATFRVAVQI